MRVGSASLCPGDLTEAHDLWFNGPAIRWEEAGPVANDEGRKTSVWADAVFGSVPDPKRPGPRKPKQTLVRKGR